MNDILRRLLSRTRTIPTWVWILTAILAVGIVLRTYHFREWMTFNPDQARDALLVQDVLAGRAPLPLLGPQAGNTAFKLGPIFYHFEIVSAKLFGTDAVSMAYPDLMFSILTMPLLFAFLLNFFGKRLALVLTALYSVSFFIVTYSRFAFNPNSIPFFTLLFLTGLLAIMNAGKSEKLSSASMAGIAMGVGIQLHALLLVAMPIVAATVFIFQFARSRFVWKSALTMLACSLLMNIPQIVDGSQAGGSNFRAFVGGAGAETRSSDSKLARNTVNDISCHIQGVAYIATGIGNGDKCDLMNLRSRIASKGIRTNVEDIVIAAIGVLLYVGGSALLVIRARRETDEQKRNFLLLCGSYSLVVFLIFIPVSASVSIRYFIVIAFVPFLFIGLWIRVIADRFQEKVAKSVCLLAMVGFATSNVSSISDAVAKLSDGSASTVDVAVYGEVERMGSYIMDGNVSDREIYLSGGSKYLKRFYMPLKYFAARGGIVLTKVDSERPVDPNVPMYSITKRRPGTVSSGVDVTLRRDFGNVSIVRVETSGAESDE
ncbi:MAG TPA: glycosyltransferase family 39 protein [Candidatus Fimivivens sp.]|nr:glycosyltransferase family 39 protein [Candidatus Fimivivens sp.]